MAKWSRTRRDDDGLKIRSMDRPFELDGGAVPRALLSSNLHHHIMASAVAKPQRKRNRKRKRRAVSSSSSSSDLSSDSDAPTSSKAIITDLGVHAHPPPVTHPSSSLEQESSSSSDSEATDHESAQSKRHHMSVDNDVDVVHVTRPRSPTPLPSTIPPFAPVDASEGEPESQNDEVLKMRFRKFWMSNVVDAFENDLVEIRKVCSWRTSALSCIDSQEPTRNQISQPLAFPCL